MNVTLNVISRITAGESILRMGAGIPTHSRLQTLAWILFVIDFFVATTGLLRGMVPNDILAILAVAVTIGVVVASEGARGSICECYAPRSTVVRVCVHAL